MRQCYAGVRERGAVNQDGREVGSRSKHANRCRVQKVEPGTGRVLHTFKSAGQAARSMDSACQSALSNAMKSGTSWRGFLWRKVGA